MAATDAHLVALLLTFYISSIAMVADIISSYFSIVPWLTASVVAYYVVRALLLPRPISGILHSPGVTNNLLGDLPDLLRWRAATGEVASFVKRKSSELQTPVFQLFLRPFSKPWIVVTDFRESQDIVLRRTKEFDRGPLFKDLIGQLVPYGMVHMPTDSAWKRQRLLVGDTMSPIFLSTVSVPSIYKTCKGLISLWLEKSRLAQGRPFNAKDDIYRHGFETIWTLTFGNSLSDTIEQTSLLMGKEHVSVPVSMDEPVELVAKTDGITFAHVRTLFSSIEIPRSSLMPRLHHWLALRLVPSYRRALTHIHHAIKTQAELALQKCRSKTDESITCALDRVIRQEVQQAVKAGRAANIHDPHIRDELFSFIFAGYETSSTTLCWSLKFLTDAPSVQSKLRSRLFAYFGRRTDGSGTCPSARDIADAKIPYLEATMQELHRLSGTLTEIIRTTTQNVEVLGHAIPKDTTLLLFTQGPDFVSPSLPVKEDKRSQTSRFARDKSGSWHPNTVHEFSPERWLDDAGTEFNPCAGPSMPFGGGTRGCFGRRQAELQLKIVLTLILWNFELQPIPAHLGGFSAQDGITHVPSRVYLRLSPVKDHS